MSTWIPGQRLQFEPRIIGSSGVQVIQGAGVINVNRTEVRGTKVNPVQPLADQEVGEWYRKNKLNIQQTDWEKTMLANPVDVFPEPSNSVSNSLSSSPTVSTSPSMPPSLSASNSTSLSNSASASNSLSVSDSMSYSYSSSVSISTSVSNSASNSASGSTSPSMGPSTSPSPSVGS